MQLLIVQGTVQCECKQFLPEVLKYSGDVHSSRMQMPSSLLGRQESTRISFYKFKQVATTQNPIKRHVVV